MKQLIIYTLLAILPLNLAYSNSSSRDLVGTWVDHYSDTKVEIKYWRKGLKARKRSRNRKGKWRKFYKMGYGVFDDCNGRAIIVNGFNEIKWKDRRNRIYLTRYNEYGYNRRNSYDRRRNYDRDDYNYGRSRSRRNIDRGRSPSYRSNFSGSWYCSDRDLSVEIVLFGNGIRARRPRGEWVYYDRYNDREYRDRRGNTYYLDGDDLYWRESRGNRLRFSRR